MFDPRLAPAMFGANQREAWPSLGKPKSGNAVCGMTGFRVPSICLRICLFSPVGFKGSRSLLDTCSSFPGVEKPNGRCASHGRIGMREKVLSAGDAEPEPLEIPFSDEAPALRVATPFVGRHGVGSRACSSKAWKGKKGQRDLKSGWGNTGATNKDGSFKHSWARWKRPNLEMCLGGLGRKDQPCVCSTRASAGETRVTQDSGG